MATDSMAKGQGVRASEELLSRTAPGAYVTRMSHRQKLYGQGSLESNDCVAYSATVDERPLSHRARRKAKKREKDRTRSGRAGPAPQEPAKAAPPTTTSRPEIEAHLVFSDTEESRTQKRSLFGAVEQRFQSFGISSVDTPPPHRECAFNTANMSQASMALKASPRVLDQLGLLLDCDPDIPSDLERHGELTELTRKMVETGLRTTLRPGLSVQLAVPEKPTQYVCNVLRQATESARVSDFSMDEARIKSRSRRGKLASADIRVVPSRAFFGYLERDGGAVAAVQLDPVGFFMLQNNLPSRLPVQALTAPGSLVFSHPFEVVEGNSDDWKAALRTMRSHGMVHRTRPLHMLFAEAMKREPTRSPNEALDDLCYGPSYTFLGTVVPKTVSKVYAGVIHWLDQFVFASPTAEKDAASWALQAALNWRKSLLDKFRATQRNYAGLPRVRNAHFARLAQRSETQEYMKLLDLDERRRYVETVLGPAAHAAAMRSIDLDQCIVRKSVRKRVIQAQRDKRFVSGEFLDAHHFQPDYEALRAAESYEARRSHKRFSKRAVRRIVQAQGLGDSNMLDAIVDFIMDWLKTTRFYRAIAENIELRVARLANMVLCITALCNADFKTLKYLAVQAAALWPLTAINLLKKFSGFIAAAIDKLWHLPSDCLSLLHDWMHGAPEREPPPEFSHLGKVSEKLSDALNWLSGNGPNPLPPVAHGPKTDHVGLGKLLLGLSPIAGLAALLGVENVTEAEEQEMTKTFKVAQTVNAVNHATEGIWGSIMSFVSAVCHTFDIPDPTNLGRTLFLRDYTELDRRARTYKREPLTDETVMDAERLDHDVKAFERRYRTSESYMRYSRQLTELRANVDVVKKNVHLYNVNKSGNNEMVTYLLYGKPGVGKTVALTLIADAIIRTLGHEPGPQTKFDFPTGKYWDGFNENTIVINWDEFGARQPSPDLADQLITFLGLAGGSSAPLNMAACESKNVMSNTAGFLGGTTNLRKFGVFQPCIANVDAIRRRWRLYVEIRRFNPTDVNWEDTSFLIRGEDLDFVAQHLGLQPERVATEFGYDLGLEVDLSQLVQGLIALRVRNKRISETSRNLAPVIPCPDGGLQLYPRAEAFEDQVDCDQGPDWWKQLGENDKYYPLGYQGPTPDKPWDELWTFATAVESHHSVRDFFGGDWCPVRNDRSPYAAKHHICRKCGRVALHLYETRLRVCYDCCGRVMPAEYFHDPCPDCTESVERSRAALRGSGDLAATLPLSDVARARPTPTLDLAPFSSCKVCLPQTRLDYAVRRFRSCERGGDCLWRYPRTVQTVVRGLYDPTARRVPVSPAQRRESLLLKRGGVLLLAIVAGFAGFKLLKGVIGMFHAPDAQAGEPSQERHYRTISGPRQRAPIVQADTQAEGFLQQSLKSLFKPYVLVHIRKAVDKYLPAWGVFVADDVFGVPLHSAGTAGEFRLITRGQANRDAWHPYDKDNTFVMGDILFVWVNPTAYPRFSAVTHFLAEDSQIFSSQCWLSTPGDCFGDATTGIQQAIAPGKRRKSTYYSGKTSITQDLYSYQARTEPGFCMSSCTAVHLGTHKVFGFHVAGSDGIGYCQPYLLAEHEKVLAWRASLNTKPEAEAFANYLAITDFKFPWETDERTPAHDSPALDVLVVTEDHGELYGRPVRAKVKVAAHLDNSGVKRSILWPFAEEFRLAYNLKMVGPARYMYRTDTGDMMPYIQYRYQHKSTAATDAHIPWSILSEAIDEWDKRMTWKDWQERTPLDVLEEDGPGAIPLKTSIGAYKKPGMNLAQDYILPHDDTCPPGCTKRHWDPFQLKLLYNIQDCMEAHCVPFIPFTTAGKVEALKSEGRCRLGFDDEPGHTCGFHCVQTKCPRTIYPGCKMSVAVFKAEFGHIQESFNDPDNFTSALGKDLADFMPRLHERMTTTDPTGYVVGSDVSALDESTPWCIAMSFAYWMIEKRRPHATPEKKKQLWAFVMATIENQRIVGDKIITEYGRNASGSWLVTFMNIFAVFMAVFTTLVKRVREGRNSGQPDIFDSCGLGDDLIAAFGKLDGLRDKIFGCFNEEEAEQWLSEFYSEVFLLTGIKFTSSTDKNKPPTPVLFEKEGFLGRECNLLAPLNLQSIYKIVASTNDNIPIVIQSQVSAFLMELARWGPTAYNHWIARLRSHTVGCPQLHGYEWPTWQTALGSPGNESDRRVFKQVHFESGLNGGALLPLGGGRPKLVFGLPPPTLGGPSYAAAAAATFITWMLGLTAGLDCTGFQILASRRVDLHELPPEPVRLEAMTLDRFTTCATCRRQVTGVVARVRDEGNRVSEFCSMCSLGVRMRHNYPSPSSGLMWVNECVADIAACFKTRTRLLPTLQCAVSIGLVAWFWRDFTAHPDWCNLLRYSTIFQTLCVMGVMARPEYGGPSGYVTGALVEEAFKVGLTAYMGVPYFVTGAAFAVAEGRPGCTMLAHAGTLSHLVNNFVCMLHVRERGNIHLGVPMPTWAIICYGMKIPMAWYVPDRWLKWLAGFTLVASAATVIFEECYANLAPPSPHYRMVPWGLAGYANVGSFGATASSIGSTIRFWITRETHCAHGSECRPQAGAMDVLRSQTSHLIVENDSFLSVPNTDQDILSVDTTPDDVQVEHVDERIAVEACPVDVVAVTSGCNLPQLPSGPMEFSICNTNVVMQRHAIANGVAGDLVCQMSLPSDCTSNAIFNEAKARFRFCRWRNMVVRCKLNVSGAAGAFLVCIAPIAYYSGDRWPVAGVSTLNQAMMRPHKIVSAGDVFSVDVPFIGGRAVPHSEPFVQVSVFVLSPVVTGIPMSALQATMTCTCYAEWEWFTPVRQPVVERPVLIDFEEVAPAPARPFRGQPQRRHGGFGGADPLEWARAAAGAVTRAGRKAIGTFKDAAAQASVFATELADTASKVGGLALALGFDRPNAPALPGQYFTFGEVTHGQFGGGTFAARVEVNQAGGDAPDGTGVFGTGWRNVSLEEIAGIPSIINRGALMPSFSEESVPLHCSIMEGWTHNMTGINGTLTPGMALAAHAGQAKFDCEFTVLFTPPPGTTGMVRMLLDVDINGDLGAIPDPDADLHMHYTDFNFDTHSGLLAVTFTVPWLYTEMIRYLGVDGTPVWRTVDDVQRGAGMLHMINLGVTNQTGAGVPYVVLARMINTEFYNFPSVVSWPAAEGPNFFEGLTSFKQDGVVGGRQRIETFCDIFKIDSPSLKVVRTAPGVMRVTLDRNHTPDGSYRDWRYFRTHSLGCTTHDIGDARDNIIPLFRAHSGGTILTIPLKPGEKVRVIATPAYNLPVNQFCAAPDNDICAPWKEICGDHTSLARFEIPAFHNDPHDTGRQIVHIEFTGSDEFVIYQAVADDAAVAVFSGPSSSHHPFVDLLL